jgi:hypothetical protein
MSVDFDGDYVALYSRRQSSSNPNKFFVEQIKIF